jgi:hypothetical protein
MTTFWRIFHHEGKISPGCTATKSHLCIPRKGIARPQSQFPYSCVCERYIYIFPRLVHIYTCSRIGRPILGIYKSLTDTWIWKWGLRLRYSCSGNIGLEFLVLCLCIVARPPPFAISIIQLSGEDALPLFLLYPYINSVVWKMVCSIQFFPVRVFF